MPKVSVIVPSYNHAPFLPQRLESILSQTLQDFEMILLDDCSTDGSQDIIRHYKSKYPRIRASINERNSGSPFKQWDCGVIQAEGEYVWIAESDDVAAPDFLEKMVPLLENNPHVGLAYCDALIIDDKGQFTGSISNDYSSADKRRTSDYLNSGRDEIEKYLCVSNTINNASSVLFRKTAYINAGLADADMRYCGDWFLYLRMLLATDIGYVAKPLNFLRIHGGSSCHRYYADDLYLQEMLRIYRFIMQSLPPPSMKRIHNEILKHFCRAVGKGFIPSNQVIGGMRRMVPFFELNVVRFLVNHFMTRYLTR